MLSVGLTGRWKVELLPEAGEPLASFNCKHALTDLPYTLLEKGMVEAYFLRFGEISAEAASKELEMRKYLPVRREAIQLLRPVLGDEILFQEMSCVVLLGETLWVVEDLKQRKPALRPYWASNAMHSDLIGVHAFVLAMRVSDRVFDTVLRARREAARIRKEESKA